MSGIQNVKDVAESIRTVSDLVRVLNEDLFRLAQVYRVLAEVDQLRGLEREKDTEVAAVATEVPSAFERKQLYRLP